MNKNTILIILIVGAVIIGYFIYTKPSQHISSPNQTVEVSSSESKPVETKKTDTEVIVEGVKIGIEKGEEWLKERRIKDSIRLANKEKVWVYQIGMPKSSPEELFQNYKKLQGAGNICLVKVSRNSYYLIQHEGYNKFEIETQEAVTKERMEDLGVHETIKIVDLNSLCSGKDEIEMGKSEKVKKEKIACYVCK